VKTLKTFQTVSLGTWVNKAASFARRIYVESPRDSIKGVEERGLVQ
jgi:hypothetical protein